MRQAENEGAHIWLRQSATFSVNGQTRTVEIAIPLRPGATAEEVELLLSEADAGMERLSRHLDGRVDAITGDAGSVAAETQVAAAIPAPNAGATQAPAPAAAPTRPAPSISPATPSAARPGPASPPATAAHRETPPSAPPARPAPSAPAAAPAAQSRPSSPLAPAAEIPSGPDITRPEFIKAAAELGLDVRQAMLRLGVRSLEGLNLRESLEVLRRQALQGNDSPAQATAAPSAPRSSTSAPAAPASHSQPASARPAAPTSRIAPAQQPRYFDEEDDEEEFTYTIDAEELEAEIAGDGAYGLNDGMPAPIGRAGDDDYNELDDFDLDDVPDFGPPAAAPAAPPSRRATGRPAAPASASAPSPAAPEVQAEEAAPASPAVELIARLRAVQPGGGLSSQQRKAYQNIVVAELGETRAAGLIKGIWGLTPDRLGAEQVDELLSWGKRDTFADEATQVLAELRAERERANGATAKPPATGTTPRAATRTRSSAPRPPEDGGGF